MAPRSSLDDASCVTLINIHRKSQKKYPVLIHAGVATATGVYDSIWYGTASWESAQFRIDHQWWATEHFDYTTQTEPTNCSHWNYHRGDVDGDGVLDLAVGNS